LTASDFDLALLDLAFAKEASSDLLSELRDSRGNLIPVVVFGANSENFADEVEKRAALSESLTFIDSLVTTVRERLASRQPSYPAKSYA
jgi:hypothetical protein